MQHNAAKRSSAHEGLPYDLIVEKIAPLLSPNEVACSLRRIDKYMANSCRHYTLVRLSDPIPHHALIELLDDGNFVHGLNLKQRKRLLCHLASSGVVENLEAALPVVDCPLTEKVVAAAAKKGHVAMIKWLIQKGCPYDFMEIISYAAYAGHKNVVHWVLHGGVVGLPPDELKDLAETALDAAAYAGHGELCDELLAVRGVECMDETVLRAAEGGHADLVRRLLEHLKRSAGYAAGGGIDTGSTLLPSAVYGFNLAALQQLFQSVLGGKTPEEVELFKQQFGPKMAFSALQSRTPDWRAKFEWLEAQGCSLVGDDDDADDADAVGPGVALVNDWSPVLALVDGPLPVLQDEVERLVLMQERGSIDVLECLSEAVDSGNADVVRHLRQIPGLLDDNLLDFVDDDFVDEAAQRGHLNVLVELLAAGWDISPAAACAAARNGHLHVLKWMEGPEGDPEAAEALQEAMQDPYFNLIAVGAESGSVELVAWLRERGCPWNQKAFVAAAKSGNAAMLEWMATEGCPMGGNDGDACLMAACNGDFATLRCLKRLGCPWGNNTFLDAVCGYSDPPNDCSLKVLRRLVTEGCPVDWWAAKTRAQARLVIDEWWGNTEPAVEVLEWIESHLAAGA
ncbi:hypothetical protein PLESTB_001718600 [Pleodorina starrii]|uniref:Ankyrin repeat domain-containing protein n=1 Tax=Pleodorina starrii TaxID=330485 RepID=A0A9W6F978_9CHLO|nr:hypothetical protein PLESTM_001875200 [Pleodorina starrii]GLC61107.1 hypothetical protein PLESTB_001718600 [Pleodorina starrii]GLC69562.1 hypothetical protein PLESTF_000847800 [Pleodorina starrii]